MVDIDGVVSLFGPSQPAGTTGAGVAPERRWALSGAPLLSSGPSETPPVEGRLHAIEGIPHFLSATAAAHLLALAPLFELVWASGWEEKANEYLPRLLGLPGPLPFLRFGEAPGASASPRAHWKLDSIDGYAGERALAWIDDAFSPACHDWAKARAAPTLLVSTLPDQGLTAREAELLAAWAGHHSQSGQPQE